MLVYQRVEDNVDLSPPIQASTLQVGKIFQQPLGTRLLPHGDRQPTPPGHVPPPEIRPY